MDTTQAEQVRALVNTLSDLYQMDGVWWVNKETTTKLINRAFKQACRLEELTFGADIATK